MAATAAIGLLPKSLAHDAIQTSYSYLKTAVLLVMQTRVFIHFVTCLFTTGSTRSAHWHNPAQPI